MEKNNKELIEQLNQIPMFSALDDEQLTEVKKSSQLIDLRAGMNLFRQGEEAKAFYFVLSGQIQLSLLSERGEEKVIDVVHTGQLFAEAVSFMERQCYPVNSDAIQDSQLIAFDNETFREILKGSVNTCFRLMAMMSHRLHIQLMEIDNLSLRNASYRLAHYLLKSIPDDSSEETEIILDYPKSILASRLSIKPETFSRILSNLKQGKIIDVRKNQIAIKDINALRKFMHG